MKNKLVHVAYLAAIVVAYAWGGLTVQNELFPYYELRSLRNSMAPQPYVRKPRTTVFETFTPKVDVVMVGDSITNGAEWSDVFPDVVIANRGIGGDKTYDVLQRIDSVVSTQPGKAFLMMGTNDIANNVPLSDIMDNYKRIVAELHEHDVDVHIQSTLECNLDRAKDCRRRIDQIRALNGMLKDYAANSGSVYIDLNARMSTTDGGLREDFTYDGIHLLGPGYLEWSRILADYL